MKYITVQITALPALGFGTWQLTGQGCRQSTRKAIEIGYRHIDTAQIYENEAEVGSAIADCGITRSEIFLTTKLWTSNYTAARVASSMEESLQKLQTNYVDLLLMHWPNPAVPLSETLQAMRELVNQGKARAIGVSNFPVALMREAMKECPQIICNQVEYHALLSQRPVLDFIQSHSMILTAYSPLARGRLAKHPLLERIGKKYGKTAGQIALRWLIDQKDVAAIPKAASEKNARLNFDIFDFDIAEADRAEIDALRGNNRFVNPGFSPQWDAA